MRRFGFLVTTSVVAAVLLSGCSSNDGGATKCKDFNTQDQKEQTSAVAAMLKEEKGKDASNFEISATRLSALAFCKSVAKQDSTISDINHG
jgi:acid stress chaperone HdeA